MGHAISESVLALQGIVIFSPPTHTIPSHFVPSCTIKHSIPFFIKLSDHFITSFFVLNNAIGTRRAIQILRKTLRDVSLRVMTTHWWWEVQRCELLWMTVHIDML